ncbi:phage major tail protein, TP901-1 family [Alteribacillus sp. YIM 98480]|uniref:phage major tail protein, TP901-1 family n=1 Tax=Alteribacillus sp. YIM 98480 TaxID=2606599 RepID=UPI00131DB015|nr:phage major tail protein, TP901-1 family [Alteribacillus sp. YIM 98480]
MRGVDFLINVNTGDESTPAYEPIAAQRGGTFTRGYDTIDMTSKDNSGWADSDYGNGNWSISGDGVLQESDPAFEALDTAFLNAEVILVQFEFPNGKKYEGKAVITDLSIEAPHDDVATYSIELTGKGQYEEVDAA